MRTIVSVLLCMLISFACKRAKEIFPANVPLSWHGIDTNAITKGNFSIGRVNYFYPPEDISAIWHTDSLYGGINFNNPVITIKFALDFNSLHKNDDLVNNLSQHTVEVYRHDTMIAYATPSDQVSFRITKRNSAGKYSGYCSAKIQGRLTLCEASKLQAFFGADKLYFQGLLDNYMFNTIEDSYQSFQNDYSRFIQ